MQHPPSRVGPPVGLHQRDFRLIARRGFGDGWNAYAPSMAWFGDHLYVATTRGNFPLMKKRLPIGPAPPELIRVYPDKSWELIVGESRNTRDGYKQAISGYLPGFDNFFNGYFWRMCEHQGWLYLSTFEWSAFLGYANRSNWPQAFTNIINDVGPESILERHSGFDLYRSHDGQNWVPVTTNGMGNPYNIGLRTLVSTEHGLFLGTSNPFGPQIMQLGKDRYEPNPRGGCEVYLGNHDTTHDSR